MKYPRKNFVPEYSAIKNAINRCQSEDHIAYPRYGGRGIKVSPDLCGPYALDLLIDAIGPRPSSDHSLDRIDNNGDYTLDPLNLRWADRKTQQTNMRKRGRRVTDYGYGVSYSKRCPGGIKNGQQSALLPYQGRTQTIADWARELGINPATIRQRMERGLSPEQALDKNTSRTGEKRKARTKPDAQTPHVELLDQTNDPLKASIDAWIAQANSAISAIESRPN